MFLYSEREIMEKYGLTRIQMYRMRNGEKQRKKVGGAIKEYHYKGILNIDEDYIYIKSRIFYNESGLQKILKAKNLTDI
jgi:hypothetical protein